MKFINDILLAIGIRNGVGIWFGKSAKELDEGKIKEFVKKYIDEMQAKSSGISYGDSSMPMSRDELSGMGDSLIQSLYDFRGWGASAPKINNAGTWGSVIPEKDQRVAKKPVEVKTELTYQPFELALEGLDEKIALCKRKQAVVTQHYSASELNGIIERLELRKKYADFRDFYEKFPYTTDEKIEELLAKYKLVMKDPQIFIGNFPEEALHVMEEYTKSTIKLCGKKPVYMLIAEESQFQAAYKKKDPILLAQSPFCFNWQILGAWDEEMLLLSEL